MKLGWCALPYAAESTWGVHLNPAIGEIEYKGLRRHLTPQEFKVLSRLMHSEVVTKNELYETLKGVPYDPRDAAYGRVYIARLRTLLKGFPLRIHTWSGYGYQLVKK